MGSIPGRARSWDREHTDLSGTASVFEDVSLMLEKYSRFIVAVPHSMLFPLEPCWVTLYLLGSAVQFSIVILVVDTGFSGWVCGFS